MQVIGEDFSEEDQAKADAEVSEFNPAYDLYKVTPIWATQGGDDLIAYMARVSNSKAQPGDPSAKLIGYLLRNHHWSPFEMASFCVEIRTQRDISAQILRHWSSRFQEFSTRYAEVEDLLAVTECRFQDPKNRQGSFSVSDMVKSWVDETGEHGDSFPGVEVNGFQIEETVSYFDAVVNETRARSLEAYQELLRRGVAKEVARRILPIGLTPTKLYMVNNLRGWLTYTAERTKAGVQKEHRLIAQAVAIELAVAFPATMQAALDNSLYAGALPEFVADLSVAAEAGGRAVLHP